MISQLTGTLDSIEQNSIIMDVNGVGYRIYVPLSSLSALPRVGEKMKIYTHHVVREDANDLYGFLRKEERNLFSMLISVSGIGPRSAAAIMGGIKMEDLVIAITKGNVDLITRTPGIGLKTAQKLVIELKEKIAKAYSISASDVVKGMPADSPLMSEAVSALMTLGYTAREAKEAIVGSGLDLAKASGVEEVIRKSLKVLA
jgi:Holliday junction DNA helicase RuvA